MWREGEEKGGKERNREEKGGKERKREEEEGILRITQIGDSASAMEEKKNPVVNEARTWGL